MTWMTDAILVLNEKNSDGNSIKDIASAISQIGDIHEIDEQTGTIRVSIEPNHLEDVKYMDGVDYIRPFMVYQRVLGERNDEI